MVILDFFMAIWLAVVGLFSPGPSIDTTPAVDDPNESAGYTLRQEILRGPTVGFNVKPQTLVNEHDALGSAHITTDDTYRYIESDGIPNHTTGRFPNSGNPNTISAQNHSFRMLLNPIYLEKSVPVQLPGVALNGVPIEPGTAEVNKGYNYEAFQNELNLGLDENNAHVQPNGTYHYHGIPEGLIDYLDTSEDIVHVGWAADGFKIVISQSDAYKSSYRLKTGERPDIGGEYDGTYTQDFEYVEGLGDLDDCNGIKLSKEYVYFMTDEFQYAPRCLHGIPDESFERNPGAPGATGNHSTPEDTEGPPAEAATACSGESSGSSCSFTGARGETISGTCNNTPNGLACVPVGGPPRP